MEFFNRINVLINKNHLKQLLFISLLIIISVFLELITLASIPYLIKNLSSNALLEVDYFNFLIEKFELSPRVFLNWLLFFVLLIYILKSIFNVLTTFKQNKVLSDITAHVSTNLFSLYLKQNYKFHNSNNSSDLIKNIQIETSYLNTYLMSLIILIVEATMLLTATFFLIFYQPIAMTAVLFFFVLGGSIFYRITKNRLVIWGDKREEYDSLLTKYANQSLNSIKDIILRSNQGFFVNKFSLVAQNKSIVISRHASISQIPRFYFELLSVFGLGIYFLISQIYYPDENIFASLGLFVAATFRIIPSLNRIMASLQSIKFYDSSLKQISSEFLNQSKEYKFSSEKIAFKSIISLNDISYSHDGKNLFNNLSFEILKGDKVGIIGKSGSGKSTLLNIILGFLPLQSGSFTVDDVNIKNDDSNWRDLLGYVSQNTYLLDDSIINNILFGFNVDNIDYEKVDKIITDLDLNSFIENLPNGLNTIVGENGAKLSGGQIQRLGVARALYKDCDILILDEVTSSLDSETESKVMNSIYKSVIDKTLVIVTHRLDTLFNCSKVFELKKGHLNYIKDE